MKYRILVVLALLPMMMLAESDQGVWESVSVSKDFGKRWDLGAEVDFRTSDWMQFVSRTSVGVDADYKILDWLRAGAGYSYILDHNPASVKNDYKKSGAFNGYNADESYWRNKHRLYIGLTGKWKVGRLSIALRERYQYTRFVPGSCLRTRYRNPIANPAGISAPLVEVGGYYFWPDDVVPAKDAKSGKDTHILRSRLALEYNIRHCPVTPNVSYEMQNILDEGFAVNKHRITAGIEWKISKKYFLDFDYVYQHDFRESEYEAANIHALSIGAKIKL